jgi:hypothetical protein
MQGFWLTLGWSLAALLAVSVLVALVEGLRRAQAPARPPALPVRPALPLDIDLDALPGQDPRATLPPAAADPDARRQALADVLQRLQQAGADAPWVETTPMVLASRTASDPNVA